MSIYRSLPATPKKAKDFKRHIFAVCFAFAFMFTLSFLFTSHPSDTSATLSGFSAGNIINDYTMSNYNSMSEADIQAWLTSKNSCNNRDYSLYQRKSAQYNWKGYYWHWNDGHFVCLSEERFGNYANEIGSGETAAHIIWQAAQDYHINPQVLLVLLQKETGLITDTIPNTWDYNRATGYGCPDTAPCDTQYYGFKNQVRHAAELFHNVLIGEWSCGNYPAFQTVFVKYHPSYPDGSWVYIENRATGALYRYTPYQPNAAALAAGYGTGDYLSSYGNRNFYNYFTDWFGSTQNSPNIARRQIIPDGIYTIVSELTYDTRLSTTGTVNGSNTEMSDRNDSSTKWRVTYNDDYTYTFINAASGLALDIVGASTDNGTNVQTYAPNGTCAQKWYAVPRNNGAYTFLSACSLISALDIKSGSKASGANVQIYTDNSTLAQAWRFVPTAKTVDDGLYDITTSLGSNLSLDISGGVDKASNGTNVQIYASNQTLAQKWQLTFNERTGSYTIINPTTGLALDVKSAGISNGTNIHTYASNNTCAQSWYILPSRAKGGDYEVISSCSGLALDVSSAKNISGTNIQAYQQNQTIAQSWHFNPTRIEPPIPDGTYEIISNITRDGTELALDISGGVSGAGNGTNVWLYEKNGTDAQKWKLTYNIKGDNYTIINPITGLSLDISSASQFSGANVQIYSSNNTAAQRWKIVKSADGYASISAVCSGLLVDVAGAKNSNGANIWQYVGNGTVAQQWNFIPIGD